MLDVMTTRDVADALGIHVATVSRRVAEGSLEPVAKLPGIRGAFLFDRVAVERLRDEEASS